MADNKLPRDEREFGAEIAVQTPPWLPGVNIGVKYRRLWDKRAAALLEDAASLAASTTHHLLDELENPNSGFPDLVGRIIGRCNERGGDPVYRSALSRLIAAALHDDALIDEVAYISDRIITLDPVHVRVVALLPYESLKEALDDGNPLALLALREKLISREADVFLKQQRWPDAYTYSSRAKPTTLETLDMAGYSRALRTSKHILEAVFYEVSEVGFVVSSTSGSPNDGFQPTDLGMAAARLINTEITPNVADS